MTFKTPADLLADLLEVKLVASDYSEIVVTRGALPDDDSAFAVAVQASEASYDQTISKAKLNGQVYARSLDIKDAEALAQICHSLLHRVYDYVDSDSLQTITYVQANGSPTLQARLMKGPYAVYGFAVTAEVTR